MTETPRTPDHLNDLDRRVYDLAVQTMPLAEIAVRLGVSIRQADEKVQRILERMGVPDRESLRNSANPVAEAITDDNEPESGPEAAESASAPMPSTISRRHILIGGASLAVLAGGAAVGFRLSNRGGRAPAATREPTRQIDLSGLPAFELAPPWTEAGIPIKDEPGLGLRFEKARFTPDLAIDWPHGLFRTRPGANTVEGFRFLALDSDPPDTGLQFNGYAVGLGGRFVWAVNGATMRGYLADWTDQERCWSWPIDEVRLVTAFTSVEDGYLVFEHVTGLSWQGTGRYTVIRVPSPLNLTPAQHVGDFSLGGSSFGNASLHHVRGMAALWSSNGSTDLRLHEVDLTTATVRNTLPVPSTFENLGTISPGPLERSGDGNLLAKWGYRRPDGGLAALGAVLGWDDASSWNPDLAIPMEWGASIDVASGAVVEESPQRFVAIESSDGGRDYWPEIRMRDFRDQDGFSYRLLSASSSYGDNLPSNRWLADGSGFVAMVRGPETDGSNLDAFEYAIVSADGRSVTRIPLPPPGGEPRWWNSNSMRGAVPSPYNPNLISFGRTELYNVASGEWFRPNITSEAGPDHLDPWAAGPEFMVFALPHGGHGGASPPVLLNLKREEPPYVSRHFIFVVAGTGDSLRLRAEPSLDAEVLANLPDSTVVSLNEDPTRPEGLRAVDRTDGILWIRVRTLDGQSGWVSSTYLNWQ